MYEIAEVVCISWVTFPKYSGELYKWNSADFGKKQVPCCSLKSTGSYKQNEHFTIWSQYACMHDIVT